MGIGDKVTGRLKQAAGDLLGDDATKQQGVDEERKGEAKQDLAKQEMEADKEEAKAEAKREEVDKLERRT